MSDIKIINKITMVASVALVTLAIFVQVLIVSLAGDDTSVKVIQLGTAGISDPDTSGETYSYSMVYYGAWSADDSEAEPVLWRVLDADAAVTGVDGDYETEKNAMFLLSEYLLDTMEFGSNNIWSGSYVQTWCKNFSGETTSTSVRTAFSVKELAAIVSTKKDSSTYGDYTDAALTGEKVFLLSSSEADTYFGSISDRRAYMLGSDTSSETGSWWWLRSSYDINSALAAAVNIHGYNEQFFFNSNYWGYSVGVRPALNLDLSSILFTSAAVGGKSSSAEDEADGLFAIETAEVDAWKITLLDESREFTIAGADDGVTGCVGGTTSLSYSGAETGDSEYISVIISEKKLIDVERAIETEELLYYGRVAKLSSSDNANGTVEITIPSDIKSGTYTLYVFNEQYNGDYNTDYSSAFSKVTLTISAAHSLRQVDEVTSTCTKDGNDAYWQCSTCENLFADSNGVYSLTSVPTITAEGHSWGDDDNGICSVCGQYEPAEWNATDNCYEISNAGQLFWFAAMVNNDSTYADFEESNSSANAKLTADIDLENKSWTPISNSYSGTFDGDNHTITNLSVNNSGNNVGFFGSVSGATIQNLTVEGTCGSGDYTGGIIGYATSVTLKNCISKVAVSGGEFAGGLVGYVVGDLIIDQCANLVAVSSSVWAGGLVGGLKLNSGNCNVTIEITNSYNLGNISGKYGAGGLIGYVYTLGAVEQTSSFTFKNCYNAGSVSASCQGAICCDFDCENGGFSVYLYNLYYLSCSSEVAYGSFHANGVNAESTVATGEQFTSGEICYLLNGSSSADGVIWGQTLSGDNVDDTPVFNADTFGEDTVLPVGKTVYYTAYYTCAGVNYNYAYTNLGESCTDAHNLNPVNAKEPTCTDEGYIAHYKCSVCSALFEDKDAQTELTEDEVTIAALEHNWSIAGYEWADDGSACTVTVTCENEKDHTHTFMVNADSDEELTCKYCDLLMTAGISSAILKAATCTEEGTTLYSISGYVTYTKSDGLSDEFYFPTEGDDDEAVKASIKVDDIEKEEHTEAEEWIVTKEATCTVAGEKELRCAVCEEVLKTETINATDHNLVADKAVAATCTETGLTAGSHCSACGEILVSQETTAALGHDYSSEITTPATCTKDGVKTYSCNRCEASYTEAIATTGHTYTSVITSATTETEGYTTYTCVACGDSYISDYTDLLTSDIYITETVSDSLSPSVDLADSEEVKSALIMEDLSEEIQQAIITGEDVYVHLEVTTIDETALTEEEIALVAEILGEDTVGTYLDFSIWVQCGEYTQKATLLADGINLMVSIPTELINIDANYNRTYYIIRIHEGVAERIDGTFDEESGQFVFQTECFSTYILAYTDVEITENEEDEPKEAEDENIEDEELNDEEIENEEIAVILTVTEIDEDISPKTSEDAFNLWLIFMLSTGVAMASYRRYRKVSA